MPVNRFTYETIAKIYGESFASLWFRPVSAVFKETNWASADCERPGPASRTPRALGAMSPASARAHSGLSSDRDAPRRRS